MSDALIDEGRAQAEALGRRHEVPADAVAMLLVAIRRGGGRQAQFSHPALGGMGQWSRGGGIMIGDMFNHSLKAKVERLCNELAERTDDEFLFAAERMGSASQGWPDGLGRPSSTGSQNEQGYACFPETRRLAIRGVDGLRIYDTGDHRISGVSQQQGGGRDLAFTSQHGTVRLLDLEQVEGDLPVRNGAEPERASSSEEERTLDDRQQPDPAVGSDRPAREHDVLETLERLHELRLDGVLTEAEFSEKKKEMLGRL